MKSVDSELGFIHISMGICFKKNIKIYPIIFNRKYLKIEINNNGRKKQGTQTYDPKTEQKELQQKIAELYRLVAKRIQQEQ